MIRHFDRALFRAFLLFTFAAGSSGCDGVIEEARPAPPAMVAPADGATDQANALELRWSASAGALTYHVQVARTAQFSNTEADKQEVRTTSFDVKGLQLGVPYYWRVRALNDAGVSDWSTPWTFTPTSEAVLPGAPGLRAPANNSEAMPTAVTFAWTAAPGARSYHIQISQEPTFLRKDVDIQDVLRTSKPIDQLVHGYTYFWRVRAHNPAGFSPWSNTWTFVVETN